MKGYYGYWPKECDELGIMGKIVNKAVYATAVVAFGALLILILKLTK